MHETHEQRMKRRVIAAAHTVYVPVASLVALHASYCIIVLTSKTDLY